MIFPTLQNIYKDYMDRPIRLCTVLAHSMRLQLASVSTWLCGQVDSASVPDLHEFHGKAMANFLIYKVCTLLAQCPSQH